MVFQPSRALRKHLQRYKGQVFNQQLHNKEHVVHQATTSPSGGANPTSPNITSRRKHPQANMRTLHTLSALLPALSHLISTASALSRKPSTAVLLSDVKSLTFQAGKLTTHRRVPALPQLNCVGGSAATLYTPDTIRCTNSGSSYSASDVEWTCTASLPPEFKLGSTDVVCEGYDSPADAYVLKGSCAVEYRLVLTEAGEGRYGARRDTGYSGARGKGQGSGMVGVAFWVLFVGVVGWMGYSAWRNSRAGNAPRRPPFSLFGGGGGGGGGGSDDNDPPPPYDSGPPRKAARSYGSTSAYGGVGGNSWRPGFWSGTAAGAAAAYLAGQGGRTRAPRQEPRGSWFGGNGEGSSSGRRSGYGGGSWGSSSGSPSYSSTRYESTGFGGTSRR